MRAAGLAVLSRESRAEPFRCDGVGELPVSVDWLRQRRGVRVTRAELGTALAAAAQADGPSGVMLHHAVMDRDDREGVADLLALLVSSPSVRLANMPVAAAAATTPASLRSIAHSSFPAAANAATKRA